MIKKNPGTVEQRKFIALNLEREIHLIKDSQLSEIAEIDLDEKIIQLSKKTQIQWYHSPYSKIISEHEGRIIGEFPVQPNGFYPLIPLDFVEGIRNYIKDGIAFPVYLFVNPTNICNYNCQPCFSKDERSLTNISIEEYKEIIKEMKKHNNVIGQSISGGGEPTQYPHFAEMLDFSMKNDVLSFITTNGTSNKEMISKITDAVSIFCFSALGVNPYAYSTITGNGTKNAFQGLLNNIEHAVEQKEKNNRDMIIGVTSVVHPFNTGHYMEFANRIFDMGVDYLHFNPLLPNYKHHGMKITHEEVEKIKREMDDVIQTYKNSRLYVRTTYPDIKEQEIWYFDPNYRENKDVCLISILQPSMMPNCHTGESKLVACRYQPTITENPNFWYSGNICDKDNNFKKIWNQSRIRAISNNAYHCRSCCSEKQLMTLDWMYSEIKRQHDIRFHLVFEV